MFLIILSGLLLSGRRNHDAIDASLEIKRNVIQHHLRVSLGVITCIIAGKGKETRPRWLAQHVVPNN